MWILPADLSGLHVDLDEGPHLLPWHYTDDEIDRLAWILRGALPGVEGELRLDDATLKVLSERGVKAPTSLGLAVLRERSPALDEVSDRVRALGARCALIQFPEPQEMGYGWLERQVKAPLYRAIGAWVKRPEHPLSALNVRALPVMDAAALTTDPVELVDLLERTLRHRLHYASVGVEEPDYHRSLYLSAGERLAARLGRLGSVGNALEAALEVMLLEKGVLLDRDRFRAGAAALESVGLGRRIAGEFALGPLARSATEPRVLGALETSLHPAAISEAARASIVAIRRGVPQVVVGPAIVPLAIAGAPEPASHGAPPADAFPDDPTAGDADRLARGLMGMSPQSPLPPSIRERTTAALRWAEVAEQSGDPEKRSFARLHKLLLLFLTARGAETLERQASVLPLLDEALADEAEPFRSELLAIVKLYHAWSLFTMQRGDADATSARVHALGSIEALRNVPSSVDALVSARILLAGLEAKRAAYPAAREWADKALDTASAKGFRRGTAAALDALANIAIQEGRWSEAEQRATEALSVYEQLGDDQAVASSLRNLAAAKLQSDNLTDARQLLRRATEIAEGSGDRMGLAESMLGMSHVHAKANEIVLAEQLARQALALYEEVGSVIGCAKASFLIGTLLASRADIDEAQSMLERALALFERLGDPAKVAAMKQVLDQVNAHPNFMAVHG